MNGGRPHLVVCKDSDALSRNVATAIGQMIDEIARTPVTIALSGGSTPKRLYETLAAEPFRGRLPWQSVELFFGDERTVSPDHPDSNYGMARRALLDPLGLEAHRMPAAEGDAAGYERLVRHRVPAGEDGIPAFDLVLLGVGEDGHTASLFPGTAALDERERLVVMNDVPSLGTRRMTFTFPLLEAARRVWVLASGAAKRAIVARCLDPAGADLPVARARPRSGELVWWLDEAAFSGKEPS